MKYNPKVYLEAAKRIETEEREFSCNAIYSVERKGATPFAPKYGHENLYDLVMKGNMGYVSVPQFSLQPDPKGLRVLALCMMAAICKDFED